MVPLPLYPSFTSTYHSDQYAAIDPTQPSLDCTGKTVLVTGAGRGIGKAIAIAFAQANARGIALVGRTMSSLEEAAKEIKQVNANVELVVVTADITDSAQVQAAVDTIVDRLGVPDVLVNNAGGLHGMGPLIDADLDDVWKAFELNVKGPVNVTQAYLRAHRTRSPDTPRVVINIPSGAAHLPYAPGAAAYACSKLASAKLTEYLHHENPEWIATDLARKAGRKAPDTPELPAGFAVWLATQPEAKAVLNGRFIWANWDVTELLARRDEILSKDLLTLTLKGWGEDVSAEEMKRRAVSVHRDAEKGR
ncbi:hypothetical protein LTR56_000634 [Elasticomyces elasticus]|nr:hypothetical protein LTR56_000634 [Elasticomyces elasticus]KAK3664411.1 hypothetical protein LTR22_004824 [Elasticomyces elasticus]KAK4919413.1 hypothetical protein LTR49_012947 [Elasticomyces elasticus]KAK5758287.1 hypothetical protein LTS12_011610 [Elasticomyces elasticus]